MFSFVIPLLAKDKIRPELYNISQTHVKKVGMLSKRKRVMVADFFAIFVYNYDSTVVQLCISKIRSMYSLINRLRN